MTHGSNFKLFNILRAKNADLTHEDVNTCDDEPDNRLNILLVLYYTVPSRAKPTSDGRLSYCALSFGISASAKNISIRAE